MSQNVTTISKPEPVGRVVRALARIFHPFLLRRPKSFRDCVMFRSTILGRKNTTAVVNLTCLATKELTLFLGYGASRRNG
jgi:hypothetical protein